MLGVMAIGAFAARLNTLLKNSNGAARRTEVCLTLIKNKGLIGTAEAVP